MDSVMNELVIFEIDGGSLKLIGQWQDELPNLKRIMEEGVYGELEFTMHPITCPAQPSMFTGKHPGKLACMPSSAWNQVQNTTSKYVVHWTFPVARHFRHQTSQKMGRESDNSS